MALFSNIQSSWADHYGSIDTKNIKIRSLVIILWWNILGRQQTTLNSLLSTIPKRNYHTDRGGLILQKKIRKFAQNRQTNEQTNKQTNKQTENSKTEATLSPVDRRGTRANSINERKC